MTYTDFNTLHPRDTSGRFEFKAYKEAAGGTDTLSYPPPLEDLHMRVGDTIRMDRSDLGGVYSVFDKVDITKTGDDAYSAEAHVPLANTLRTVREACGVPDEGHDQWAARYTAPMKDILQAKYGMSHFATTAEGEMQAVFGYDRHIYDHQVPDDISAMLETDTGAGQLVMDVDDFDPDEPEGSVVAKMTQLLVAYDKVSDMSDVDAIRKGVETNGRLLDEHGDEMDEFDVQACRVVAAWCNQRITELEG